ncbi:MAG: universal stress protein [Alphaproteobacteria bacterium]|nr:universal stress protein [Alphaproteobacteria bacterium]MBP9776394.1 universal stress protein [Alphaproteobacteria bacterium]
MIKSILVTLDNSQSSESAKELGIHLAKLHNASLTGIGILDEPWIVAPEAIPLGGAAFKVELDTQLLQDARRHVHKLEKTFVEYCKSHQITCSIVDAAGVPTYEIEKFLTEHDILIMGKEANFHFNATEETTFSIKQILKDNPRPIIVTSSDLPNQHSPHVFVAFDGTFASSRALHMALLIGIFKGKTVHIVTVSSDEEEAQNYVNIAAKLCKNHGVTTHLHPITSSHKASKSLLELMDDLKPCLIVMGAFGHGGISHFFRGSCTKDLLRLTHIPLFIFH